MRKLLFILFLFLLISPGFSQELPSAYRAYTGKYPEGPALNYWDSVYLMNIPEKIMPAGLRSDPLPPVVDNSTLPYLRPVFEQIHPSCGQAAMVGYNFTYEMACKRDQPALFPQTQYPTHFTYNFQNGGNAWYGVSYFHSIEILRQCGCMNSYDYGDYYDDGMRWINGYDLYYNGMYNRVKGVYSIPTGTEEGLLALKHWLYDHMGESLYGGVASYYANVPWNAEILEDNTPEAGKHVMTAWFPIASHAMTIVGYNDSIRWDYNGDGSYTNHIDLNGDEIIDPRDWELGAVKFVNSHGLDAQDSGFCYMMYKCLAETFENGGVWNQEVHILDIEENYQPLLTYKVKLRHSFREKVKILAGVSQDTTDGAPSWLMVFPIIDYQGGEHFMQGQDTAEYLQYLEFGLDITPLLSNLNPGEPARFFFMVDENDPRNDGQGEITSFSVMDYTSGGQEIESDDTPVELANHSRCLASVVHTPDFEIIEITTDSLPVFTVDEPYSYQLNAEGGSSPYLWDAKYDYRMEQSVESFPVVDDLQVIYGPDSDTIVPVPLGFNFPYYGELYDTVYMHINGHLQLDNAQMPWPYMLEPDLLFSSNRMIAPMTYVSFTINSNDNDGGWASFNDTSATFRWRLSTTGHPASTDMNFAVRLDHNGMIDFIYGATTYDEIPWLSGISAGNNKDFVKSRYTGDVDVPEGTKISFYKQPLPAQLQLSESGLLSGNFDSGDFICDLSLRVTDRAGLSDTKSFQLTSGPYLYFTIDAGGDDRLDYGDTVVLDLEIRNGGATALLNSSVEIMGSDPFIDLIDPLCFPGNIMPGQSVIIPDAFTFILSLDVPDLHDLFFNVLLQSEDKTWHKDLIFKTNAPVLQLSRIIDDDENGKLDPGETAPMMITLKNAGHVAYEGITAELFSLDEQVQVLGNPVQDFGTIGKGSSVTRPYVLVADESLYDGFTAYFVLHTQSLSGLQHYDTIGLMIGMTPVLVIDMDPNNHSGPGIFQQLNDLNVIAGYEYNISDKIDDYKSLFICLGYHNTNHVLTLWEGQKLADYLDSGGSIYMEGRKTWKDDPGTPVHPKFNINWAGAPTVFDTITGIEGTFTQGLELLNAAIAPISFYHLEPVDPAYTILQDNNLAVPCAIAYDAGTYKTIGTLFEYGTLADFSPNAAKELMIGYLDFFGIEVNPVGLEKAPVEESDFQLLVYPNPAGQQITVSSQRSAVVGRRSSVVGRRSSVSGLRSVASLGIFDLYGREVKRFSDVDSFPYLIDISDLPDGIYVIRMFSDNGPAASAKFLKISYF